MDIETLIPHQDRMRLIGEVVSVDGGTAVTASVVTEAWPLYRDGSVDALVTIELVAQTAAVIEGWKRQQKKRGGTKGWLVGIKSADFRVPRIPLSARLIVEARRDCALEGYAVFEGTVRLGTEVAAVVSIQAFRPEEDDWRLLFGGYGYCEEYPIARAWRDIRVTRILGSTNEIMRGIIARRLGL